MIAIWHINVYTLSHVIGLRCTRAIPHGACPFTRIHTWLSWDICENTLGPTFWQSEMRHRGAYQKDEFTAGSAELEKGDSRNPKWELLRITHAAHIYSTTRGDWTKQQDSRHSSGNRKEKDYKAKTPIHPDQGQDHCQDLIAKSRAEL